jgi:hypothetical protein
MIPVRTQNDRHWVVVYAMDDKGVPVARELDLNMVDYVKIYFDNDLETPRQVEVTTGAFMKPLLLGRESCAVFLDAWRGYRKLENENKDGEADKTGKTGIRPSLLVIPDATQLKGP